jgi:hypothetical protein
MDCLEHVTISWARINVSVTAIFDIIPAVGINILTGLIGAMVDVGL